MEPIFMIRIKGRAIIASSNFAKDLIKQDTNQPVVMDLQTNKESFTALGNILTGIIHLNGAFLAAPWVNLNVQTSVL